MKKLRINPIVARAALGLSFFITMSLVSAADLNQAIDQGVKRSQAAKHAQQTIDAIDGETQAMEAEYRAVVKEIEGLKVYVKQLDKQLASQQQELSDIDASIRQVTLIERQITPLMLKMIDSLGQFVASDVPFQKNERIARVEALRALMARSDVTVAEKYRKLGDAYQKEMDYGRTIKSYRAPLQINGETKAVDFLRVGRVALLYRSSDGESMGAWNVAEQSWQSLGSEYNSKLMSALRIAREQAAPNLIKVPVSSAQPSEVQL